MVQVEILYADTLVELQESINAYLCSTSHNKNVKDIKLTANEYDYIAMIIMEK